MGVKIHYLEYVRCATLADLVIKNKYCGDLNAVLNDGCTGRAQYPCEWKNYLRLNLQEPQRCPSQ